MPKSRKYFSVVLVVVLVNFMASLFTDVLASPVGNLESFYETSFSTPGSTLPPIDLIAQLNSRTPPCTDYQELRRQVYELALEQQENPANTPPTDLVAFAITPEELEELETIKKYSRLGWDKLTAALKRYQDLHKEKKELQAQLDVIYKNRTEAVYALRRLDDSGDPDNPDIKTIQDNIEALIKAKASKHEAKIAEIDVAMQRERALVGFFEEAYHLHKDFKTYAPCMSCMHSEVNAFLMPCGHTFCSDCIRSYEQMNKSRTCPCCRASYRSVGKLFI